MRKKLAVALLITTAMPAVAEKNKGATTLKDVQTSGQIDKDHSHQQYDLLFNTDDKSYTCRTDGKHSMNATDFVVGSVLTYQIDGKQGELKNKDGKDVKCKIVRVEMLGTAH